MAISKVTITLDNTALQEVIESLSSRQRLLNAVGVSITDQVRAQVEADNAKQAALQKRAQEKAAKKKPK